MVIYAYCMSLQSDLWVLRRCFDISPMDLSKLFPALVATLFWFLIKYKIKKTLSKTILNFQVAQTFAHFPEDNSREVPDNFPFKWFRCFRNGYWTYFLCSCLLCLVTILDCCQIHKKYKLKKIIQWNNVGSI